jgi:dTDP-4-dehydrorhamnose reductase
MRVLIVGCNGLLGQNLLRTAPSGHSLIGLARHPQAVLSERLGTYHARDIADPATWDFVRDTLKPDFIFNAAAYTDVDGCERDPELARRVNRDAVRAMAQTGIPLVHLSTDYVFDGTAGPYSEEDDVEPLSTYGRIKLESEAEALMGSPKNLVVRTMWVWGNAKATGDSGSGAKKSFTDFVRESLQAGKPARIVSDQVGNPTLAEDLALAIWVLVGSKCSGIYHVSGSDRISRLDWAQRVAKFYGLDSAEHAALITPITTAELNLPAARPLQSGLRGDKLERDTGLVLGGLDAQLQDHRAAST